MPKKEQPAEKADRKQESRHQQWWYPTRCELEGCNVAEGLLKCSACNMVQYCCKEHQRQDWPLHKEECKVFQRVGARATFYKDADMLTKFPLTPPARFNEVAGHDERIPKDATCPLCLKTGKQVPMKRTECCNQVICDTSANYQMMSYSREFCERSHDRYTLCGYHGIEDHCERDKDWRACSGCLKDISTGETADTLWRGLNPYNFYPLLSKDVPCHGLCERCGKCQQKFISGVEGCSYGANGLACLRCVG